MPVLISIAIIIFAGLAMGAVCRKIRFPALFGMIIAGIIVGPHVLNLLDDSILSISAELRKIALIIILIRAGLKFELADLKKVGRSAVLLCFVPACFEVVGVVVLAPIFLGLSRLEAAILGAVVAAVSPAVVVPRMIKLIDMGYGAEKGIPQMILAGASVDDVFVIVLFTTFTGLARGESVSWLSFAGIPASIALGVAAGIGVGLVCAALFQKLRVAPTVQAIVGLATAFVLNWIESTAVIPFAGLIATMAVGAALRRKNVETAAKQAAIFDKMWIPAEIFLFVLVGASVAVDSIGEAGVGAIALVLCALVFRMVGVFICVAASPLNVRERLFCMLAYTPKATVQAAIGGLPLTMGLPCGMTVLVVSVIAILLTAPLGAFAIDLTYAKLLSKKEDRPQADPPERSF